MKFLMTFLLLAGGYFLAMVVIQQVAGWDQTFADIGLTALIFGVLGTALMHVYLRYIRKRKSS